MKKEKKNPYEGMGRVVLEGMPEATIDEIRLAVTDGFIRAAYGMRGTGELSERLEKMLGQWRYTSPVTGLTYGPEPPGARQ